MAGFDSFFTGSLTVFSVFALISVGFFGFTLSVNSKLTDPEPMASCTFDLSAPEVKISVTRTKVRCCLCPRVRFELCLRRRFTNFIVFSPLI